MAALAYNEEASRRLLAIYITPDVEAQRKQFLEAIPLRQGEHVLDVGTGPGFLARAIAGKVGSRGSVCGVDVSEFLLDVAREGTKEMKGIEFAFGDATNLPYPDGKFDAVVCTQVLEYLPEVDKALAEFYRVTRNGGWLAVLDTDWDSVVWHSSDRERMNRVLTAWEAHAADPFLPRTLAEKMKQAGFHVEKHTIIPIFNPVYKPDTYSNRLIDLIIPFVVEQGNINQDEAGKWGSELRDNGKDGSYFFSLNRYLFLARKI